MLTNSRDAFRSQSRSPNIMLGVHTNNSFLLVCNSNFIFKTRRCSDFHDTYTTTNIFVSASDTIRFYYIEGRLH